MDAKEFQLRYGEIVTNCWENEDYKKSFIENPDKYLTEIGIDIPDGVHYKVIVAKPNENYIILPYEGIKEAVEMLSKNLLMVSENNQVIVPMGQELRIVQNSENTRYVLLPPSPKSIIEANLELLNTGLLGGTTAQVETAVQVVVAAETAVTFSVAGAALYVAAGAAIVLAGVVFII
ncbi:hypothetical protein [Ruminococcus flavefaciens]|uniref:hypothetical protein n=1 Tax=Ruminococcus flavefaciens TaxID=1265 RepID=UPI0002F50FE4|nr:hypothetical protein [Ruminococcus flavefaciens]